MESYNKPETWGDLHDEGWWASVLSDHQDQLKVTQPGQKTPQAKNVVAQPKTDVANDWEYITRALQNDVVLNVKVDNCNKGGLLVSTEKIQGFVPASHLIDLPSDCPEERRNQYYQNYIHKLIKVKVIECDPDKQRVVLSERASLAGDGKRNNILKSLKQDDIVEGKVTNITDFGVFLDLGGVEGLIHISELSWGRVNDLKQFVCVGETIKAVVLQVGKIDGRIALSRKRLFPNPWEDFEKCHSIGEIIAVRITKVINYGIFAQTHEGIEGLIHISTINCHPNTSSLKMLSPGDEVFVKIQQIDAMKRRLSLILCEDQ